MEWDESTPLSPANLNDLEDRITAALDEVTAKKSIIAEAITDMGQSASSGDTFTELATKIRDISDDADAAVGNVLSGKTFYQGGSKKTGTMPNRAGDTAALAMSIDGTTLKLRASEGYRDGIDDNVTITDANHIPSNIKDGVTVLGVTGEGLKYYTGDVLGLNQAGPQTFSLLWTCPYIVYTNCLTDTHIFFSVWDGGTPFIKKYALNGSLVWTSPSTTNVIHSMVVDKNGYIWCTKDSLVLEKRSGTDGSLVASYNLSPPQGLYIQNLQYNAASHVLLACCRYGSILAINPDTGAVTSTFTGSSSFRAEASFSRDGNYIFIVYNSTTVYKFAASNIAEGNQIWSANALTGAYTRVAEGSNGMLYYGGYFTYNSKNCLGVGRISAAGVVESAYTPIRNITDTLLTGDMFRDSEGNLILAGDKDYFAADTYSLTVIQPSGAAGVTAYPSIYCDDRRADFGNNGYFVAGDRIYRIINTLT